MLSDAYFDAKCYFDGTSLCHVHKFESIFYVPTIYNSSPSSQSSCLSMLLSYSFIFVFYVITRTIQNQWEGRTHICNKLRCSNIPSNSRHTQINGDVPYKMNCIRNVFVYYKGFCIIFCLIASHRIWLFCLNFAFLYSTYRGKKWNMIFLIQHPIFTVFLYCTVHLAINSSFYILNNSFLDNIEYW